MSVFHLVYRSHASENLSSAVIQDILSFARENNKKQNISGLLIQRQGAFIQLLEGEEWAVRKLYRKIRRDPRHHKSYTLLELKTESRLFGQWAMAYVDDENVILSSEKLFEIFDAVLDQQTLYLNHLGLRQKCHTS